MSRTQRKEKDIGADNYPTAEWAVERFLEERVDFAKAGPKWIEPCVGDGVIVEMVDRFRDDIDWTVCDIRDTSPALHRIGLTDDQITIGDFLEWAVAHKEPTFDVLMMNPPFWLTAEFVNHARKLAACVVCFQTLNLLGSEERNDWMRANVPDLYVLPDRPSHTGDGKTDAIYSGWYVWGPVTDKEPGLLTVLECTDLDERKEQMERTNCARDETTVTLDALFAEVAR